MSEPKRKRKPKKAQCPASFGGSLMCSLESGHCGPHIGEGEGRIQIWGNQ